MTLRLPDPCLVVLVGRDGGGQVGVGARVVRRPTQSSPRTGCARSSGAGERDQRASRDAFELLDLIVAKRLARGLDDRGRHDRARAPSAARRGARWRRTPACRPTRSTFDVPEKVVRERNRARGTPVPPKVVAAQLREADGGRSRRCRDEGFAGVHAAAPVELVPPAFLGAPAAAARQADAPLPLEFGLQISRFGWDGATAAALAAGRARGRGGGLHVAVGDGPLPPDPAGRARVGGHARELHDARLPGRRDVADPPRHARHRRHLPQPRAPRQGRRDARRRLRRPRAVRPRRRLVRARARALRLGASRRCASATRCSRTRSSCCR